MPARRRQSPLIARLVHDHASDEKPGRKSDDAADHKIPIRMSVAVSMMAVMAMSVVAITFEVPWAVAEILRRCGQRRGDCGKGNEGGGDLLHPLVSNADR